MSVLSNNQLLEILAARHDEMMFIWSAVDHFILAKDTLQVHGDDEIDFEYWQATLARVDEIIEQEPLLDDLWAVVGEAISFPSLVVFASSSHAMLRELAFLLDIGIGLSAMTGPARAGLVEGPTRIQDVPADMFREGLLHALETTDMPNWETSQKLKVSLEREFAKAKVHLDVLRRELERVSPRQDAIADEQTGNEVGDAGGGEDDDEADDLDEPLSPTERDILQAMFSSRIFSSDVRVPQREILPTAIGPNADFNCYKDVFSGLKKTGFLSSQPGCTGGMWLTEKGKKRAARL